MRVLIADDEPVARKVLREMLEEIPDIIVAGEAATGLDAVEQIRKFDPDLVLLDLQMPGLDGFQVACSRRNGHPLIIFVTAYHNHALQAFEAGAVDYLLKPVRKERLEIALDKARAALGIRQPGNELRRIVGRKGEDLHMLDPDEVIAFQAEGEVVHIITSSGRYYASHTLKALEEKLPRHRFRRIHRSTIINTGQIRKISPLSSKRWLLRMSNGMEVIVSKRLAGVIREETHW